ncbi:MAG: hypothetical protein WCH97_04730 [Actinomycetes bacterium]
MAKKEEPKKEPAVSNLPMPLSDNPLVIDLPDGQKLVVGKMDSGSVIEVATWRGTGRPDSRTSRLMLGMSNSQTDAAAAVPKNQAPTKPSYEVNEEATTSKGKKIGFTIPKVGAVAFKVPEINVSSLKKLDLKGIYSSIMKTKSKLVAKSKELAPVESVAELNIDQWLTSIKLEAEKKVDRKSALAASTSTKKSVKKSAPVKKSAKKTAKKR